jgi:penicillin-binding protein 1A
MTHAFNTIAHRGERVGGSLDASPGKNEDVRDLAPVGIEKVVAPDGSTLEKNEVKAMRVLPEGVADETKSLLGAVTSSGGTGDNAATPGEDWGKTGTTENSGDAWFCGGTEHLTACVWVGHAMTNTPMETEYGGQPVAGGTFPAEIWGSIMTAMEQIYGERQAERESEDDEGTSSDEYDDFSDGGGGYTPPPSASGGGSGGGGSTGQSAPAPAPAPSGGGGGATGTGGTGL